MRILLTNDDGIYAPGLRALRHALKHLGEVIVVAPASEQSAAGHSITLLTPLVVQEIREHGERIGFAVEGKPADCVKLGIVQLLGYTPDLIVSGMNAGSNAGINVLYSGTVAAAVEGAFFKITSIAVSLVDPDDASLESAAKIACGVVRQILSRRPPTGSLFNVNIPKLSGQAPKGIRVTKQGLEFYKEAYEARTDPRGRRYYWLLPDSLGPGQALDTDLAALEAGYVSVTPLSFDLTDNDRLATMADWTWD